MFVFLMKINYGSKNNDMPLLTNFLHSQSIPLNHFQYNSSPSVYFNSEEQTFCVFWRFTTVIRCRVVACRNVKKIMRAQLCSAFQRIVCLIQPSPSSLASNRTNSEINIYIQFVLCCSLLHSTKYGRQYYIICCVSKMHIVL